MDGIETKYRRCIELIMKNRYSKNDEFEKALELLKIRRNAFNIIHVSGTNGKSSVSHKISQCLISSGKMVGLYTSPHIWDYNERIKIQGKVISYEDFVRIYERISAVIGGLELHFFSVS
ncbi:folylpolyglutamate synthase, putative [Theileria equi strain WA]|uniref:Folylpolyglutamate synthase, putative n=1 Tax=Theileria equi strain WA TaxID=1537102 RepID=L0AYN5_THEEQ|nr:folylpolyglutamate synthase, putative [Theileria equi strain WA]AFZ80131.1 folylpolyglutamate synthase, putative [Theileria equi strain WA]|eukprot:XP_004829797.1 folylpolyglutamate synthase, putative [Theileria equi strain WA]